MHNLRRRCKQAALASHRGKEKKQIQSYIGESIEKWPNGFNTVAIIEKTTIKLNIVFLTSLTMNA